MSDNLARAFVEHGLQALSDAIAAAPDEQLVHLRVGDTPLVAKLPEEPRVERGSRLDFVVPRERIHLFDGETGAALNGRGVPSQEGGAQRAAERARTGP